MTGRFRWMGGSKEIPAGRGGMKKVTTMSVTHSCACCRNSLCSVGLRRTSVVATAPFHHPGTSIGFSQAVAVGVWCGTFTQDTKESSPAPTRCPWASRLFTAFLLPAMFLSALGSLSPHRGFHGVDRLTEQQAAYLPHTLKGIYAYLKDHPALMERRLYIGSKKPQLPPPDSPLSVSKRDMELDMARPACPSRTEWRLLYRARDINDTRVDVFQPALGGEGQQWFYTVSCNNNAFRTQRDCPDCCIGINHERFSSSCRTKMTYVMALIRRPWQTLFDWNWIQVPTSCNCAVTPVLPPAEPDVEATQ